jgi:hypothetical protein
MDLLELNPEPKYIGTLRANKTARAFIGPIQVKKAGCGGIHLGPGFDELVVVADRTNQFPILDYHGIRFSFAKAWHGEKG